MNADTVLLLLGALTGLLGMPIIQWLKNMMKLSDSGALAIATGISLVLGLAVAVVGGQVGAGELTLPAVIEATTVVFSVATLFYKALLADK